MPRKTKEAPGRVTPKGGAAKRTPSGSGASSYAGSTGRYTPPIPREFRSSGRGGFRLYRRLLRGRDPVILLNYLGVVR